MFRNARLPTEIAFGASSGPEFATDVFLSPAGWENRRGHWLLNRGRWEISYLNKTMPQIDVLLQFFRTVAVGRAYSFRFKDLTDFEFNNVIGTGDGTTQSFQLFKAYVSGQAQFNRILTKPIVQTIRMTINGVPTDAFVVAPNTGLVTLDVAPPAGAIIVAAGEFDCPVRFDSDTLELTAVDPGPGGIGLFSAQQVGLVEVLNEEEEPTEIWKLVYREDFEYPAVYTAWTGSAGDPHQPMREHFDVPQLGAGPPLSNDWTAVIDGFALGEVIDVRGPGLAGGTNLYMERTGYRILLSGTGGENTLRLTAKHPLQAFNSFRASSNDLEWHMAFDQPLDFYLDATGEHVFRIVLWNTFDPPGISAHRIYTLEMQIPVNTGSITSWRFGYPLSGGGFHVIAENDVTITPSTPMHFRVTTRQFADYYMMNAVSVWMSYAYTTDGALDLIYSSTTRYGDRDWIGQPASTLPFEWATTCQPLSTVMVRYDDISITGYEVPNSPQNILVGFWAMGGIDMIDLLDQWAPLAGQVSLLFRLDFYRAPGAQTGCMIRYNRPKHYTEGRYRTVWKIQQSSGTGLAYWGMYCLATYSELTAIELNWSSYGMVVEFNQATGSYTRVLFVRWNGMRNAMTILDQVPLSHPMSTPVAMELEWHRLTSTDPVSYVCRIGNNANYGDLTVALQGEVTNTLGGLARGEGPYIKMPFDGSPTAALDVMLDRVELDELIALTIVE